MPEEATFEKKSYEIPLNNELLDNSSRNIWAPGQVLENVVGFDSALLSHNQAFWSFVQKNVPPGLIPNRSTWSKAFPNVLKDNLPAFKTNLFIQAKRPSYRLGNNSSYSKLGIKGEYWKFQVIDHQQKSLEQLHKRIGHRAKVYYAAPAFHESPVLFAHIASGKLIENSNFVEAVELNGHEEWIYNQPGTVGIAHSKPAKVTGIAFESAIQELRADQSLSGADENLDILDNQIKSAIGDLDEKNPIRSEFLNRIQEARNLINQINGLSNKDSLTSYLNISVSCLLNNLNWFVTS